MFNYILTNKKLKLSYKLCKINAQYLLFKNRKIHKQYFKATTIKNIVLKL